MKRDATMSKFSLACGLTLGLAVLLGNAPPAFAMKVVRDPTVSRFPTPPKAAPPAPAVPPPVLPKLTAAQIADKNAAARGGLAKWHALQSMTLSGKVEAGGKMDTMLPYTLQLKRPNKQRLAIEFAGQTALQVFDGEHGWNLRPYLNRTDAQPFSREELQKTLDGQGMDGPLIDYAAKGSKIELEGTEMVEGKATYRLKLTNKLGHANHIWVDGTTFLEAKMEGHPHRFDGKMRPVETYLSDYREIDGVMIPYLAETRVLGWKAAHKMTIEKVALNVKFDDGLFAKPASVPAASHPRVFAVGATASTINADASGGAAAETQKSN
jgi:outer membrane lipoprotein-sorting protein